MFGINQIAIKCTTAGYVTRELHDKLYYVDIDNKIMNRDTTFKGPHCTSLP